ncbi:MAG: hypothetical protein P8Q92_14370 [Pseudoprimorskyibacter sp.]|nr:hypothetical protein [Pseudoprimorskyibacter sp.]
MALANSDLPEMRFRWAASHTSSAHGSAYAGDEANPSISRASSEKSAANQGSRSHLRIKLAFIE